MGCRDSLRVMPQIWELGQEGLVGMALDDSRGYLKWKLGRYIRSRAWGRSGPPREVDVWVLDSDGCRNLCDVRAAPTIYDY